MGWKEYINKWNKELTGKKVRYNDNIYTIAMVDMNGIVHIDKPSIHNETTAVYMIYEAQKALVQ